MEKNYESSNQKLVRDVLTVLDRFPALCATHPAPIDPGAASCESGASSPTYRDPITGKRYTLHPCKDLYGIKVARPLRDDDVSQKWRAAQVDLRGEAMPKSGMDKEPLPASLPRGSSCESGGTGGNGKPGAGGMGPPATANLTGSNNL
jgi:hypothetical protein